MSAYYNETDPFAAAWLRNLIGAGLIGAGDVDERSIVDVRGDDLAGYTQCHFFAGIGGWSYAFRLAGWPDDRPVWTGSCPCQPFSSAGKMGRFIDERHLWPAWIRLIEERSPPVILGEQVASATEWLRLVRGDLEALGYAVGAIPIEAASAGADHLRDRFWFVADRDQEHVNGTGDGRPRRRDELADGRGDDMGNANGSDGERRTGSLSGTEAQVSRQDGPIDGHRPVGPQHASESHEWVIGADGKARRVKPGVRLLVDGFPARVGLLRGFGNAIDPRPAREFIEAFLDAEGR